MTVGPSAYWYLTRASGAVALILLTLSVVVGVAAIGRVKTDRWPRFAIDGIHRTGSLLALAFLIVHIATAVLDSFAPIRLVDAVIPFAENMPGGSAQRPGDVLTHRGGRASEIRDTDSEGRLIIADALAYLAERTHATLIDVATLSPTKK